MHLFEKQKRESSLLLVHSHWLPRIALANAEAKSQQLNAGSQDLHWQGMEVRAEPVWNPDTALWNAGASSISTNTQPITLSSNSITMNFLNTVIRKL